MDLYLEAMDVGFNQCNKWAPSRVVLVAGFVASAPRAQREDA
jgi:hypothetical protein